LHLVTNPAPKTSKEGGGKPQKETPLKVRQKQINEGRERKLKRARERRTDD
jgi:hypothetical protein